MKKCSRRESFSFVRAKNYFDSFVICFFSLRQKYIFFTQQRVVFFASKLEGGALSFFVRKKKRETRDKKRKK